MRTDMSIWDTASTFRYDGSFFCRYNLEDVDRAILVIQSMIAQGYDWAEWGHNYIGHNYDRAGLRLGRVGP